jgi:hypothetical protein
MMTDSTPNELQSTSWSQRMQQPITRGIANVRLILNDWNQTIWIYWCAYHHFVKTWLLCVYSIQKYNTNNGTVNPTGLRWSRSPFTSWSCFGQIFASLKPDALYRAVATAFVSVTTTQPDGYSNWTGSLVSIVEMQSYQLGSVRIPWPLLDCEFHWCPSVVLTIINQTYQIQS